MDPDECLRQLLQLAEQAIEEADMDDNEDAIDPLAVEMAEYIQALDSWLIKDGFLPRRWAKKP